MMRNSPASLALIFALARAGFVWIPVNAQLRGEGLLKRLREYESTCEAGGAEEGKRHRVLPVAQPLALGEIEQPLRGDWLLPSHGETTFLIKHIVAASDKKMSV